jgi:hypothetical protein
MLLGKRVQIPLEWRVENVQMRRETAYIEGPLFSKKQLQDSMLDILFQQTWCLMPSITAVLETIPKFKTLQGAKWEETLIQIEHELTSAFDLVKTLNASLENSGLFSTIQEKDYISKHVECCPPLPFTPFHLQNPTAGVLRCMLLSSHNYILEVLYAPVRQGGRRFEPLEAERETAESYAIEICRAYSAVEEAFEDKRAYCTCLQELVMAAFNCPSDFRPWLWHKLAHLEELGEGDVLPIKQAQAVFWKMPELLINGFRVREFAPLKRPQSLIVEDIGLASDIVRLSIETLEEEEETDSV